MFSSIFLAGVALMNGCSMDYKLAPVENEVRIGFVFASDAVTHFSDADRQAWTDFLVTVTQDTLINSGVNLDVVNAGLGVSSTSSSGYGSDNSERLDNFRLDGDTQVFRDAVEADFVILLTDPSVNSGGIAPVTMGFDEYAHEYGFAVASAEHKDVVVHEIGHMLGAQHDPAVVGDQACDPIVTYGCAHLAPTINARTVMAYPDGCPSCDRVPYYSTPRASISGVPLGDAETAWNACVADQFANYVEDLYWMSSTGEYTSYGLQRECEQYTWDTVDDQNWRVEPAGLP